MDKEQLKSLYNDKLTVLDGGRTYISISTMTF